MKDQNFQIWMMISVLLIVSLACSLGSVERFGSSEQPRDTASAAEDTIPEAVLQDEIPYPETLPASTPTQKSVLDEIIEGLVPTTKINTVDGAVMVYVPAGEFLMGSEDEDAEDDEKPEHIVYLNSFWIYQTEVTNDQYRVCVSDKACPKPFYTVYFDDPDLGNHPVVYVSWYQAHDYCVWAGGSLPTEAEWEKAARGTDGRRHPWGDEWPNCNLMNASGCKGGSAQVGSYPDGSSPYGVLDMAGNVWEWVADWYDEDYYRYSPYENPQGPKTGDERVMRGDSWFFWSSYRASNRAKALPEDYGSSRGFRCLQSP